MIFPVVLHQFVTTQVQPLAAMTLSGPKMLSATNVDPVIEYRQGNGTDGNGARIIAINQWSINRYELDLAVATLPKKGLMTRR